jgi:hypothetical protein
LSNPLRRLFGRLTEMFTTGTNAISHQLRIASSTWARRVRSALMQPTKDWARPDYDWWQRAYYCRVHGLELSGLFLRPLCSKVTAWTLGMGIEWKVDSEASQIALNDWFTQHHPDLMAGMRASLKQGDSFLVVNADLTVTLLPPDCVDPIVDEDDYSNIIGWRVAQVMQHPDTTARRMTVTDEYYAEQRIHTVAIDGKQASAQTFPNLLGRLPIVHIANGLNESDTFGHPEAEALVELLQRYNTILEAAIDGNERQGRPTPVLSFETVADLNKFWDTYGVTESRELPDGTTELVTTIGVDLTQILTVSGAEFEYKAPGSFTADTSVLLGLLFYLLLEHAEIPEFVFGNAIASSMASATTQMPIFERYIEGRRGEASGWLTETAQIVLGYLSLTTPGVTVAEPALQWKKLTQDSALTLQSISWAFSEGLLDERTALMLAPLDLKDIDQVLKLARKEREERQQQEQDMLLLAQDVQGENNDGTTEETE